MILEIAALGAAAGSIPVAERGRVAGVLHDELRAGCVLVETCQRAELYGPRAHIVELASRPGLARLDLHEGHEAARHVVRLAIGLESAVLAEDQILHQLRSAVSQARQRGPVPLDLDQLFDRAFRAGRRARSWMPAGRRDLADAAVDAIMAEHGDRGGTVLVVGAGEMGRLAATALRARGREVLVASRTPGHAAALAAALGCTAAPFDPGTAGLRSLSGVVLALAGPWMLDASSRSALLATTAWLIDLSAPPALDAAMTDALGARYRSIDSLAERVRGSRQEGQTTRLEQLAEQTLAEYLAWCASAQERSAARALADRALEARTAELTELWQRVPSIDPAAQAAIEGMAERLAERLIRDPLERLRHDSDGRLGQAARELFRL